MTLAARLRAIAMLLLATSVAPSEAVGGAQSKQSTVGDDSRVERAYAALQSFRCDSGIAALTGPYIEALRNNDRVRAARYLLLMSVGFRFDENYHAALNCCRQAALLDPASRRPTVMMAEIYGRLGRFDAAFAQLKSVENAVNQDWLVARGFGSVYSQLGDIENSHKYLQIAERLKPDDPKTHWLIAKFNYDKEADKHFELAAQAADTEFLKNMYLWQLEVRRHPKTRNRSYLNAAAKALPDDPSWRISTAWQELREGRDHEAFMAMREAVACRRLSWRAISQMALYGAYHDKVPLAWEAVDYYAKLEPTQPEIYYVRGQLYAAKQQYAEMERQFRHALSLHPHFSGCYAALSLSPGYAAQVNDSSPGVARKKDALANEWTASCPRVASAWIYKGNVLRHRGQWQAAEEAYKRARELIQYSADYKSSRAGDWLAVSVGGAVCNYHLGNLEKAVEYAAIFNQVRPDDDSIIRVRPAKIAYAALSGKAKESAAHGMMADVFFEAGDLDRCVSEYKLAIAKHDNIDWHRGLLKAYIEKRDLTGSAKEDLIVANHAVINDVPAAAKQFTSRFRTK